MNIFKGDSQILDELKQPELMVQGIEEYPRKL